MRDEDYKELLDSLDDMLLDAVRKMTDVQAFGLREFIAQRIGRPNTGE